ncbi:hypothetical protein PG990_002836 [Apiospora arundinis]
MADILPAPRAILTSLINTLASIPPAAPPGAQGVLPSNPLRFLPPSQARPLLATLHTLFPKVLLPALDLLDRRLVTRIIPVLHQHDITTTTTTTATAQDETPMKAETEPGIIPEEDKETLAPEEPNFFYLVRSGTAQQSSRRSRKTAEPPNEGGGGSGPTYVVQTQPWNCSCAEFAFSAFPAESVTPVYHISPASSSRRSIPSRHDVTKERRQKGADDADDRDDAWEFGGMSRDGAAVGTGGVPCCKHLLACVLAERWTDVLGSYVTERRVGKEEAAGLVAGI